MSLKYIWLFGPNWLIKYYAIGKPKVLNGSVLPFKYIPLFCYYEVESGSNIDTWLFVAFWVCIFKLWIWSLKF